MVKWLIRILLGLVIIVVAAYFLFADTLLKKGTITALEQQTGAEVNIDSASLSLFPFGVQYQGIALTDPGKPSHNQVQLRQAQADVELLAAIKGSYIIDNLKATGIAFDKPRGTPGKVFRAPQKIEESSTSQMSLDDLQLSAEALLEKADLQTPKAAENFKKIYEAEKQKLESLKDNLPDEAKLKQYEKELNQILKGKVKSISDFKEREKKLNALKDKVKNDKALISRLKKQIKESKKAIQDSYQVLKDAPKQDWDKIEPLIPTNQDNIANLASAFVGEKFRPYIVQALQLIQGFSSKGATEPGSEASTASAKPAIGYWLKKGEISGEVAGGQVQITLSDITDAHAVIGKDSQITWLGDKLAGSAKSQAAFNWSQKNIFKGKMQYALESLDLSKLAQNTTDKLALTDGILSFDGKGTIEGEQLQQDISASVQGPKIKSDSSGQLLQSLVKTVNQQEKADFDLGITGVLQSPQLEVKSGLDKVLQGTLSSMLSQNVAQVKGDVMARLNQQVLPHEKGLESEVGSLDNLEKQISKSDSQLSELMKKKLESPKQKLKDKLKSLFG
ncbi:TIGR03545 family protein [Algicola sagamiensis]|uniref:TIGR03545 family protein n=1 Tax=Algicola sagamiensis TaxID=163869 RepID=UPI00036A2CBA|nr:TIGR03545 family protein [Algicola sagamiensis]